LTKGLEIRAQIDTENVKGLLLINGGGAVALLAFLPTVLEKPNLGDLAIAVLWALLAFQVGLMAAVMHNRLRRVCSLVYERHDYVPPRCKLIPAWLKRSDPCVCAASMCFMWFSLAAFVAGGLFVLIAGLKVAGHTDPKQEVSCWQLRELQGTIYKVNQCTGTIERMDLTQTMPNNPLNPDAQK
jgi:hypothetical protein